MRTDSSRGGGAESNGRYAHRLRRTRAFTRLLNELTGPEDCVGDETIDAICDIIGPHRWQRVRAGALRAAKPADVARLLALALGVVQPKADLVRGLERVAQHLWQGRSWCADRGDAAP